MKFDKALLITFSVLTIGTHKCFAGHDNKIYVGGSIGRTNAYIETFNDADGQSNVFKFILGYEFEHSTTFNFALEGSYRKFGSIEKYDGGIKSDIGSIDFFGVSSYKLEGVELFGKLGLSRFHNDSVYKEWDTSTSASKFAYGIGARFNVDTLSFRIEYEEFKTSAFSLTQNKLSIISVGATFSF